MDDRTREDKGEAQCAESMFDSDEAKFIRENIKCRYCRIFVPVENGSTDQQSQCKCGLALKEHRNPKQALESSPTDSSTEWDGKNHTETVPTNAFGEIEFVGYGDKVAKYVRVDYETKTGMMEKLMTEKWGMEPPQLLISVTGGARNFRMSAKLKDAFSRGLMKAALSTEAWIVTGGTNTGVMKHVGEAVRDYGLMAESRVIAIGIAAWGCVQNKKVLESDKECGKWPTRYRMKLDPELKLSFLDPNHTHFILVDNGTQRKFGTEIEFRAKLEKEISTWKINTDSVCVPVVLLVLEGGPGTLETVKSAIQKETPTIIFKGSGKCADILAYAAQNIRKPEEVGTDSLKMDEKLKGEISQMVEETFVKEDVTKRVEDVETCVQKPHLISVYELETAAGATGSGVDIAILRALLKAKNGHVMHQLKLALAWNRIDIAKSEIFTDERTWKIDSLDDIMMTAIQLDRVDFVDFFLDNGVLLEDFLSKKRLLDLYNEIPQNCLLHKLLKKKVKPSEKPRFSLKTVRDLLQDLIGDYFLRDYLKLDVQGDDTPNEANTGVPLNNMDTSEGTQKKTDTQTVLLSDSEKAGSKLRPAQHLFLWAVLMNKLDLAKLFWRKGNESTAAALVASSVLKAMSKRTDDTDTKKRLQESVDEFDSLAIGVINECYERDEDKAQKLLTREISNWGHTSCVLIAMQFDNKRFLHQTACQSLLNTIWMGSMAQDNSLRRLLPSMFFFPLIFLLIKFRDKEQAASGTFNSRKRGASTLASSGEQSKESKKKDPRPRGMSRSNKIKTFYTAPKVIFILNLVSYLVFLLLYSFILLVQLSRDFHFLEAILTGWVFTIFLEEIRQVMTKNAHSVRSKLRSFFKDWWNVLDMLTIVLFFLGLALRLVPDAWGLDVARVVLSFNLLCFFFRLLHIFSVNKELGPKLVMIRRMIRDLMYFVMILMVFVGAFAIASEAILYPETELSWKLLYHLPRKAYWHIYGELFLEDLEGDESACTNDPALYRDYQYPRCQSAIGSYLVPVMMGVYMLITNVLLLNLLIAMFSYTFQKIQEETDMHWHFQRFTLIHEYYERPWLPPPFMLLYHVFMAARWCYRWSYCMCSIHKPLSSAFCKQMDPREKNELIQWECIIADTYYTKKEDSQTHTVDAKVKVMMEKLDMMQTQMSQLFDLMPHQFDQRLSSPEEQRNSL